VTTRRVLTATVAAFLITVASANAPDYAVIVVGSEPEAIVAAISAAESGAKTLLVSRDHRLGGLFVEGMLNMLDLRTQPYNYQGGVFERWWGMVGRATSFDVTEAEIAFRVLLKQAGVDIKLGSGPIRLEVGQDRKVIGVWAETTLYLANQVIDGTSEMSAAAGAGANYTLGFNSLGLDRRMADTLVFRVVGVDWDTLINGIKIRGRSYASANNNAAWGHFGGYPAGYKAADPNLRLRGLNLGRQNDGSVLINALLIHGIDPFSQDSLNAGRNQAASEAVRVVRYLSREIPGFQKAQLAGVAERLYIRETRHLEALCRLTIDHVLDNRVTPLDVVTGGYPLDVQPLSLSDSGFVFGTPVIYGARLCVTVPENLDGIWVVGKAAGFDPIAASSARVVPFGMALGEAVGVAAAKASSEELTPHMIVKNISVQREIRRILLQRGAVLPPLHNQAPVGPYTHPNYEAYRLLLSRGLAVGGYDNDPELDSSMSILNYIYLLSNVGTRFFRNETLGQDLINMYGTVDGLLTPTLALEITRVAAGIAATRPLTLDAKILKDLNLLIIGYQLSNPISRGQMYQLASAIAALSVAP
jgi:hypothetical protein